MILLEGRREIPLEFALRARAAGGFLTARFRRATLHSGNASGSDGAFSVGVAEVDPARLHIVTPSPNHRMHARLAGAVFDSLTDLSEAQRLLLSQACTHSLIEAGEEIEALKILGKHQLGEPAYYDWLRGLALHRAGDREQAASSFQRYFAEWPSDIIGGTMVEKLNAEE